MTLHLLKLCVGSDDVAALRAWQGEEAAEARRRGERYVPSHWTRMMPKRRDEILDGGSLYWVMSGMIAVRQRIVGLEPEVDENGRPFCRILFARRLVLVEPRPHRPFQGWRYLEAVDAPPDLTAVAGPGTRSPPARMLAELRALGLL